MVNTVCLFLIDWFSNTSFFITEECDVCYKKKFIIFRTFVTMTVCQIQFAIIIVQFGVTLAKRKHFWFFFLTHPIAILLTTLIFIKRTTNLEKEKERELYLTRVSSLYTNNWYSRRLWLYLWARKYYKKPEPQLTLALTNPNN